MSLPTFALNIGFPASPLNTAPVFTDISADLEILAISRGRQTDDDTASTGTANATLNDDARKYDPTNTAGLYYPNVQVMKPVQILATLDGVTYPQFYGWVDVTSGWVRLETEPSRASVMLPCNDGFEILSQGRVFTRTLTLDYDDAVLYNTPMAYYEMGEPSGTTAIDASGNGNNGTYAAGVTLNQAGEIPGDPGKSALFGNSATSKMTGFVGAFTHISPVNSTRTFMGWANRAATTDADNLFGNGTPSLIPISLSIASGSQDVTWQVNIGGVARTVTWTAAWPGINADVHWALTYDPTAGSAELFINSVSQGVKTLTATAGSYGDLGLIVGAAVVQGNTTSPWNGKQSRFAVFPTILSAATIASIYAARLVYPTSSPASPGCALAQELTGSRIGNLLGGGAAGGPGIGMIPIWPALWRSLDAGLATMQAQIASANAGTDALSLIRQAETSEPGFFFFTNTGYAAFRSRQSRLLATSQATFCDTHNLSGGFILYDSVTTRRTPVVNDARTTRLGGVLQESTDVTSQGTYLTRSKDFSTQHIDDATALGYSQWIVSLKKDSYEKLESLTLVPGTDSPTWLQILSRELNDRITVVRTPPGGGSAVTEDYFIEKIDITWGPGPDAKCVWRLSPAPQFNYWRAGTAGSSEAGTTTRAVY